MKSIFKITVAILCLLLLLCACGKNDNAESGAGGADYGTKIYGSTDLSDYVSLGEYKGLTVDKTSNSFKTVYDSVVENDISDNSITEKITEGTVKDGDTANIDYEGKRNGVAFEGGTAKGHDLTIGSNSFIEGFESGLIGVKIGDTVDLNLTFPESYGNADLAGAAVVFTVKVNYVKSNSAVNMENHYAELGFESFDAYKADAEKRAAQNLLYLQVYKNSEIKKYPEADKETYVNAVYEYREKYYSEIYGVDFKIVLQYNGMTVDDYRKQLNDSAESQMVDQVVYYAILQKENLKPNYELTDTEKTGQEVLDEILKVQKAVKDYLYKNATIK